MMREKKRGSHKSVTFNTKQPCILFIVNYTSVNTIKNKIISFILPRAKTAFPKL